MLGTALSYLTNSENFVKTLIIGSVLTLLNFLILPGLIVTGYLLQVMKESASGETSAPEFDNWDDLLIDGLKGLVVTIAYGFVAIVPPTIIMTTMMFGSVAQAGSIETMATVGMGFTLIAILGIVLAISYVMPAAFVNMAWEESIDGAFDFSTIKEIITSGEYLVTWLLAMGLYSAVSFITFWLWLIPILGWIAAILIVFYTAVTLSSLFGQAYGNIFNLDEPQTAESVDATA